MRIILSILLSTLSLLVIGQKLETVIQRGHDQSVIAVAISPDSNYVATGSRDRSAKLWEFSSGREIRTFLGHEGTVNCINFSKDGKYIITSSGDRTAKIWDVSTGKELFSTLPSNKILTAVAFSPDMKYFVVGGYDDECKVYDMATKKIIKKISVNADQGTGYGINIKFSPSGMWLAIGEDNRTANVYNTTTWEKKYSFTKEEGSCGGCPTWIDFSLDGHFFLMASNNSPAKRYDLRTGSLTNLFTEEIDDLAGIHFSSSGREAIAITKTNLITWNTLTGKEISNIPFNLDTDINETTITVNGKNLILACDNNTAVIWNLASKKSIQTFTGILNQRDKGGITYNPNSYWESHIAKYLRLKNQLLLSNDGKTLLKGKFGTKVKRWDIVTGRTEMEYIGHEKAAICYALSKDGTKLLTGGGDGVVIIWDMEKGDTLKTIQAHRHPIFKVQFSNDETKILTSSWDASLKVYDADTGKLLTYFDFQNAAAYDAAFSNNDLYVFTAQLDLTLRMWEMDSKKTVREFIGHTDVISSICLSPNGQQLLSASWDGSIRVWNIATGLMDTKFQDHRGGVYAITQSKDGRYVFSGGADRVVRMWDTQSGRIIKIFKGHQTDVTSILLSKDDKMLISHSTDGITKFWDINAGNEFFEHIHLGEADWMVKTTEGYFSGTEGARKVIHFVNGVKTYAVDQFFNEFYKPEILPQIFKKRGDTPVGEGIQGKLKSSPPPSLKMAILPLDDPSQVELHIKITDEGGGVTGMKVFHNGKNISINKETLTLPTSKGTSTVFKQVVNVIGGLNNFTAIATNRSNIESDHFSVEYFSENSTKSSTCYILAVGINEYKNPHMSLNYAKPDAESFVGVMGQKGNNLFKSIELFSLYDQNASKEKILTMLDDLSGKIYPEDVFIFYYAGHGSMVENRFFFIPNENARLYDLKTLQKDAIEASVLQDKLKNIKALKQLIIMDACQSGASVELLATRGASEEKAIAQLSRSVGIHVMASAGSEQFATEFSELGHGLFTYVLLKALKGEADGAPKDGKVTIYELKSYIDDQVPEMTRKMKGKPQYPYTFSRGQDFPIAIE